MFGNEPDRGPPTSLRGWLSDVYFPALLDDALGPLSIRLGPRASVDDPLFGRTAGLPALDGMLEQVKEWLTKHAASYTRGLFTTGIDRDVTEGTLSLTVDGAAIDLPVAVVAERRRSREVALRIYYTTAPLGGKATPRAALVTQDSELVLPTLVTDHLEAMKKGNVDQVLACFESDASLVEPSGAARSNADGSLRAYYTKILSNGWEATCGGAADDGRACALEYSLNKIAGRMSAPQAGLMVYQKGDSGLLHALRVYDDIVC